MPKYFLQVKKLKANKNEKIYTDVLLGLITKVY